MIDDRRIVRHGLCGVEDARLHIVEESLGERVERDAMEGMFRPWAVSSASSLQ